MAPQNVNSTSREACFWHHEGKKKGRRSTALKKSIMSGTAIIMNALLIPGPVRYANLQSADSGPD